MPRIVIDFETRSTINLKKCGAYVYTAHPDTEILMLGYKIDDESAQIWWPKDTAQALPWVWEPGWKVVAHNAEFEMCVWREIMHKRLGYPDIPLQNWDDTAARASMCALPRSLDGVCQALGLQHQKDDEGHRLMLQMCKPKPLTKKMRLELAVELGTQEDFIEQEGKYILHKLATDPEAPSYLRPDYHRFYRWKEDLASMQRLAEYCLKDVEAEYELDRVLPALPPKERRIWKLDRKINDRGIKVDIPAVKNIIYTLKKHEEKLNGLLHQLSGGAVSTAKSSAALAQFLELPNVQKTTISDALQNEEDLIKKRVLSIRQSLGQSSVAKFQSLISATDPRDSRIRGLLLYHGAGTGRWCLEENTEVLVLDINHKIYYKYIQDILPSDRLWDGDSWVSHDGVVFSGEKEIIEWNGLRASKDHKVFIDDKEALPLEEVKNRNLPIFFGNPWTTTQST